jgi:predicted Zn-dependent protease
MFSAQQDVEVGQQVSKEAERQLPMLKNSRVDTYVNNLGRKLAANAPGEKYPYQFKAVNDRAINALALPGGYVYINRGVIEAANTESQLAGMIAHEISHVALRHGANQASKASAAQAPLAILGGLLGSNSAGAMLAQLGAGFTVDSVLLNYSRAAESQADLIGTQILYDSKFDTRCARSGSAGELLVGSN